MPEPPNSFADILYSLDSIKGQWPVISSLGPGLDRRRQAGVGGTEDHRPNRA